RELVGIVVLITNTFPFESSVDDALKFRLYHRCGNMAHLHLAVTNFTVGAAKPRIARVLVVLTQTRPADMTHHQAGETLNGFLIRLALVDNTTALDFADNLGAQRLTVARRERIVFNFDASRNGSGRFKHPVAVQLLRVDAMERT